MPKIPHSAAGTRIDPLVSDASASGTRSAATAAAEPPDEPPAIRVRSCGLCVGPSWAFSVTKPYANSSMLVAPTRIAPQRSSAATASLSLAAGGSPAVTFAPARVTTPATSNKFFAAKGTPARGPGSRPAATAASIAPARVRARSAKMLVNAFQVRIDRRDARKRVGDDRTCIRRTAPYRASDFGGGHGTNTPAISISSVSSTAATSAANAARRVIAAMTPTRCCSSSGIPSTAAVASTYAAIRRGIVCHARLVRMKLACCSVQPDN